MLPIKKLPRLFLPPRAGRCLPYSIVAPAQQTPIEIRCCESLVSYNAAVFARRIKICALLFLAIPFCAAAQSATLRIKKVLPHLIDAKGRNSISPSLFERDAYQVYLRTHPSECAGIRFEVLWSGDSRDKNLSLRVEMRGAQNGKIRLEVLESPTRKKGWLNAWSSVVLRGDAYKNFGELVAWRATLWDGDQQLAEQKSFLW